MKYPPRKVEDVMLIDVLSVPSERTEDLPAAHVEWLRAHTPRRPDWRHACSTDEYASCHPLFARVVGFATAKLRRSASGFLIRSVRSETRDEATIFRFADEELSAHRGATVTYAGGQGALRLLFARMLQVGARPRLAPATHLCRHHDLADLVSLDGYVGALRRELALERIGRAVDRSPASFDALRASSDGDDHTVIETELAFRMEELANLYAGLCLFPNAVVSGSPGGS